MSSQTAPDRKPGLPQDAGAASHNAVLSALDNLSVKLIRSESEREVLRRDLDATRKLTQRLEENLKTREADTTETKSRLDTALRELDVARARQERLDEKLRESLAEVTNISRKLEAEGKRRERLYRRMDRLETYAKQAQATLEAKAMVLLTDRTLAEDSGRPMLNAHIDADIQETAASHARAPYTPPVYNVMPDVTPASAKPKAIPYIIVGLVFVLLLIIGWQAAVLFKPTAAKKETTAQQTAPETPAPTQAETKIEIPAQFLPTETTSENLTADPELPAAYQSLETRALIENDPASQHDLALLYVAGKNDIEKNSARAAKLFAMAAQGGVANASYNLGVLAHQGALGKPSDARATAYYLQAASQNHAEAMYNLGISRIEGRTLPYNPQLAAWYFAQSALGGVGEAAYNLGLILENGLLGESNIPQAMRWYELSVSLGHTGARPQLAALTATNGAITDNPLLPLSAQLAELDPTKRGEQIDAFLQADTDLQRLIPERSQVTLSEIQTLLTDKNLYNGPIDGMAGDAIRAAIRAYQTKNALPADGNGSPTLLAFLVQDVINTQ